MKQEKHYCDVCKKETQNIGLKMQVIFTTDQTEGRSRSPYFDYVALDVCPSCVAIALSGKYLFATGAQGHNEYHFAQNTK